MRILVVEPEAETAFTAEQLLQRHGHVTELAYDASHARVMCDCEGFDLMLCDPQLPDGDARELIEELLERCGIKGVAHSIHTSASDAQQKKEAREKRLLGLIAEAAGVKSSSVH